MVVPVKAHGTLVCCDRETVVASATVHGGIRTNFLMVVIMMMLSFLTTVVVGTAV